jgi:hypothetical protein
MNGPNERLALVSLYHDCVSRGMKALAVDNARYALNGEFLTERVALISLFVECIHQEAESHAIDFARATIIQETNCSQCGGQFLGFCCGPTHATIKAALTAPSKAVRDKLPKG